MLQQVCENIHNFFIKEAHPGSYVIENGMISLPYLKDGQRFWITGSDLNDGVYTWHDYGISNDDDTDVAGLRAESFSGTICAMAVPPAVIALSEEIAGWVATYGSTVNSPYLSESFNGYSYEKQTNSKVGGKSPFMGWEKVFGERLNAWRKISL